MLKTIIYEAEDCRFSLGNHVNGTELIFYVYMNQDLAKQR